MVTSQSTISLEGALSIAQEAHEGQTRRHGAPYISHPIAVGRFVEDVADALQFPVDDRTRAVALLHDVVEDSDITTAELAARFGDDVGKGVDLLTKQGKGPDATRAYYERLTREADDAVRIVKVCDRVHNLSELHLAPDLKKLEKYVDETLELIVPFAESAVDKAVAAGLVAALHDGMRAASRAQRVEVPKAVVRRDDKVPFGLYAIVESAARLDELIAGGVVLIQLRAKNTKNDRALVELARELVARVGGRVPVIINDRADVAVGADAQGVHVGLGDVPPAVARKVVGDARLVGASSHTDPELHEVLGTGADHVAVGPVFESPTKQGHAPVVGVDALAHRAKKSTLPVVAIGGITTPARAAQCGRAGAHLVAAVSALDVAEARVMARRMSVAFVAAHASSRQRARGAVARGEA
jgi:thiamine-phosphate pyrophosphorylase